jgi:hypothetical protein
VVDDPSSWVDGHGVGSRPGRERSRPHLSARPFRIQPGGSRRKFPRGLGQFPLSFLAESRWDPAPSVTLRRSLPGLRASVRKAGLCYAVARSGGTIHPIIWGEEERDGARSMSSSAVFALSIQLRRIDWKANRMSLRLPIIPRSDEGGLIRISAQRLSGLLRRLRSWPIRRQRHHAVPWSCRHR